MSSGKVTVYTDGASRGNPGPAAASFVILHDDVPIVEYAEPIGNRTNNFAEYTAMIRALECCSKMGINKLRLHSDSELMVKQMRGEYKVKHADIIPLHDRASNLVAAIGRVEFAYVPRKENAEADRLGNEALDGKPRPLPSLDGFKLSDGDDQPADKDEVPVPNAAQIAVLQRAYDSWSEGDNGLKPADVWEELQKTLIAESRLKSGSARKPAATRLKRKK